MKRNHRGLLVWQTSVELVEDIYRVTATFPKSEIYGLASQMQRAAVSVPSNIAEGSARGGTKELLHFLSIASGSLSELDTQLEIAHKLGYLKDPSGLQKKIDDVFSLLVGLNTSLKRKT